MWLYFRLTDVEPGRFEFVITNLLECLEATHWGDVRPLMRPAGGEWISAGQDDIEVDLKSGRFRFWFELPGGAVEIAYSYPYTPSMVQDLLRDLRRHEAVEISYPGKSAKGRPIPHLVIRSTSAGSEEEILWVQAREHAGETAGGYALDGFLRAAVKSSLREHFEIHALPMLDVDSVAEGRYGKEAPPVDHHMCWCPDSPRPETRLAMELMRNSVAGGRRFRLFISFHSPSPEKDSYLVPFNPTLLTDTERIRAERLCHTLSTNSPPDFPITANEMSYQRVSAWYNDDIECQPEAFVLRQFGAESCLLETAYHGSPTGTESNPEVLRNLGASLVRGLERYFFGDLRKGTPIYGSMPPVFHQNHNWALWGTPRHVRLKLDEQRAWAVGDDPSAHVYFGAPRLYELDEIGSIRVRRRNGGDARVIWCCYDQQGMRLLTVPQARTLSPNQEFQALTIPADLPSSAALVRPSFQLTGAFRPFEVQVP